MVFVTLLTLPAAVLALGEEMFGNATAVKQPEWAEGVVDVVNLGSRVYRQWVNGNENFFYRGNARALNEALRKYAEVKDDVRQLILFPGGGKTLTFERKTVDFDWQLHVPSGIYKAVARKNHAVMTVYVKAARPRGPVNRKTIEKWVEELGNDRFEKRKGAQQELQKLGKEARPFLRDALKARPNLESRRRIEALLEQWRDYDVEDLQIPRGITVASVDDLLTDYLKGLTDANPTVCAVAIQELSGLAPYSDKVVAPLTGMLKNDKQEYVRRVAAACLAQIGIKARFAIPVLKEGLKDPDANMRNAFQTAIDQIENAKDGRSQDEQENLTVLKDINEFKRATTRK